MKQQAEYEEEREVDLARWRGAIVAWWWLPVAGVVLGAIVGAILSLGGNQTYKAKALMSLGQPFAPGGGPFNSFATNPLAVGEIIRSESALKEAAAKCGTGVNSLRGKVTSAQAATGTSAATRNAAPLVTVVVQGSQPAKVQCAANELARIVRVDTTQPYVGTKIATLKRQLGSYQDQLDALVPLITELEGTLENKSLVPLDRLVIATQLDNAQTRRGQLLGLQTSAQQQLALSENVESAKVVQPAVAVKSTARSRRTSILAGAAIGLLLGLIAAIVVDTRAPRLRAV